MFGGRSKVAIYRWLKTNVYSIYNSRCANIEDNTGLLLVVDELRREVSNFKS